MLIHKETNSKYILGVWKITESADTLLSQLEKEESDTLRQEYHSESRLLEIAATRVLLSHIIDRSAKIEYQSNGKPYLRDYPLNISISHTKGYAAVILSHSEYLGIDIEYISDRVKRIRSRFISDKEFIDSENEIIHLLLHWSAKETMYKALSMEGVELKNDFLINSFTPAAAGVLTSREFYTERQLCFNIQYFITDYYVLTFMI